jgi:hypothetical protein
MRFHACSGDKHDVMFVTFCCPQARHRRHGGAPFVGEVSRRSASFDSVSAAFLCALP